jgi:hypothetical protein
MSFGRKERDKLSQGCVGEEEMEVAQMPVQVKAGLQTREFWAARTVASLEGVCYVTPAFPSWQV